MKFISLFSGIGGFDLGFERAVTVPVIEWLGKQIAEFEKRTL